MDEETIDIILATYNGEKYIKEQLDSILNQTYQNIQIYIQDDCSQDNTRQILEEYGKKDDRVHIKYNEQQLGCVKNFESLFQDVTHKYFMFSDQDDIWIPTKVEDSYNLMKEKNSDLVFTDLETINEDGEVLAKSFLQLLGVKKNIHKNKGYKLAYLRNCVTGSTILAKREIIDKVVPIPEKKPMMYDWWIALVVSQNGKVDFLDKATVRYRQHQNNVLGAFGMKNVIQDFDEYREKYIDLKLAQFKIYVENKEVFEVPQIAELAKNAIIYFENIKSKRFFNFRYYSTFFKLYNMEYFSMRMKTFAMLNLPILGRILFKYMK